MERKDKIAAILDLQINCKRGTTFDKEFTLGKYDFLIEEGFVITPNINAAKSQYQFELNNLVRTGTLAEGHTATEYLVDMETGRFTKAQRAYLDDKAKIIGLKDFLTESDTLIFPK